MTFIIRVLDKKSLLDNNNVIKMILTMGCFQCQRIVLVSCSKFSFIIFYEKYRREFFFTVLDTSYRALQYKVTNLCN